MKVNRIGTGAIWAIISVTGMTIIGELVKPVKDVLAAATGHHWITKSVLAVIVFLLIAVTGRKKTLSDKGAYVLGMKVAVAVIVCIIALFAFFVWEFLK